MLPLNFNCLFLLLCSVILGDARHNEIIVNKDRAYDVINIKLPQVIWNQALDPTPVLKSPITITVPVHVPDEEDNEVDDEIESEVTQEGGAEDTIVNNNQVFQGDIQEPILSSTAATTAAAVVTQSPLLQDEINSGGSDQQVDGQVIRFPCACVRGQCGCCTGAILNRFRMNTCGNISFVPEDFVFDVRLSVNNNTVVRRRVSASDPPPICFNPRRAPFVRVCAELSNIRIRNGNAFACLDIEADIAGFPVYSASFRCFGLGSSGIQTGLKPKPVSSGPSPVNLFGNGNSNNEGGFLENAGSILGGEGGGLFGGPGGGLFGGASDDGGPLEAIGDAVGDLFDGRKLD